MIRTCHREFLHLFLYPCIVKMHNIEDTTDCTEESRKDETCLQFKMNKYFIKTRKSIGHTIAITKTSIVHWIKNYFRWMSEHNHKNNYLNFHIFSLEKIYFLKPYNIFFNINSSWTDRCWCDFFDRIIRIYKITEIWNDTVGSV